MNILHATADTFSISRRVPVQWNTSWTCGKHAAARPTLRLLSMIFSIVCVPCLAWTPLKCSIITFRIRGYSNRLYSSSRSLTDLVSRIAPCRLRELWFFLLEYARSVSWLNVVRVSLVLLGLVLGFLVYIFVFLVFTLVVVGLFCQYHSQVIGWKDCNLLQKHFTQLISSKSTLWNLQLESDCNSLPISCTTAGGISSQPSVMMLVLLLINWVWHL